MRALVLEGGGMRAGFVACALMAFMDEVLFDFDCAVAVSASGRKSRPSGAGNSTPPR
jgi:predicted patatin/cPLA2 family phospholipase